MFTADVAVADHDEIAQDSSCMLAHSQGTFWVVDFRINTCTAPAVGLSRVPQENDNNYVNIWYHVLVSCGTKPKQKIKISTPRIRTRSYSSKIITYQVDTYNTGKIESNPLGPRFEP